MLALADGRDPQLSPVDRSRARKRLAEGLGAIARRLDSRADEHWFYTHPGVLDRFSDVPEVVRSGGEGAAADYEVDLVVAEAAEGYARASDVEKLVRGGQTGLVPRPSLLGAIVGKAVAVDVDDLPDAQRLDLALLLSIVEDPIAMAQRMTKKDRQRIRARNEMTKANGDQTRSVMHGESSMLLVSTTWMTSSSSWIGRCAVSWLTQQL